MVFVKGNQSSLLLESGPQRYDVSDCEKLPAPNHPSIGPVSTRCLTVQSVTARQLSSDQYEFFFPDQRPWVPHEGHQNSGAQDEATAFSDVPVHLMAVGEQCSSGGA